MKTIGLIGGMSWESTLVYYRLLNEGVRARRGALHSADVLLHSLDFEAVVRLQKAGRWDEAGALLGRAGAGLARAGADCLLICTNTMHLVSGAVERAGGVPLIDIIAETGRAVASAGCRRPLLLATRYTMEHGFYADRMRDAAGIDPMVPDAEDRALVHGIIFDELCQGIVRDASRARLMEAIGRGVARGADGVILGCTEICLLLDPDRLPVRGFDSTAIHAAAALDFALGAEVPALREAA
ncbi:aspartate/glutamate racemase family protein [Lichenibacterium minor]|uniref:Aspartate/glutamate racemase family protein n=1 Tax=Lichenibacterium minor TaxID=2316528 RepID=A0A4Q2UAM8_9HYPH|nr:aspartate/glutamate racemase family protein [Lichenibacterium minor]RYC33863.1 aspartate/glutamate racemase family protein [Lichenibacterium minor]